MKRNSLVILAALLGVAMIVSGCAVAVAGAAAGTGTYVWASGKLSFTTMHGIEAARKAALSGLRDMDVTVTSDVYDKLSGKIKGKTSLDESVAVDLEPQAVNVTKIDVRVGIMDRAAATTIADAIKRHLR